MRVRPGNSLFASLLFFVCSSGAAVSSSPRAAIDPCGLLTRSEVEALQGGTVKEMKSSRRAEDGLSVLHCFYLVEPFPNSVSLEVTASDPEQAGRKSARERWKEIFHGIGKPEEDPGDSKRERESEAKPGNPQRVPGIGEEAFWMRNPASGALYVLKKSDYLRISVGGPGGEAVKMEKARRLAQKALKRF